MVDDEYTQRRLFSRFLSLKGFQPITAVSGPDALAKARLLRPHLALLDISMPKMDGVQVLRRLRADPVVAEMPVILMTGLAIPEGFMEAAAENLKAGPIFAKGQSLTELGHRIESELRVGAAPVADSLRRGRLVVDVGLRQVWVDGLGVHVAGHRFDLLCALLREAGPICRRALLKVVWPMKDNANIVDVNILRLRRDLEPCAGVTVEASRAGYHLVVAAVPARAVFSV